MREEIVIAVRYNPILRREVVVRLTFTVSEGPRPDIIRRFLVREEVQRFEDNQSELSEEPYPPRLRPEEPLGPLPRGNSQD